MMQPPCKDCKKRELGCHGRCPEYQEFRKFRDNLNAERLKDSIIRETLKNGSANRGIYKGKNER